MLMKYFDLWNLILVLADCIEIVVKKSDIPTTWPSHFCYNEQLAKEWSQRSNNWGSINKSAHDAGKSFETIVALAAMNCGSPKLFHTYVKRALVFLDISQSQYIPNLQSDDLHIVGTT